MATTANWKTIKTLEQAKELVDYGVLLTWRDMKSIAKVFNESEQQALVRHFAIRLGERVSDRFSEEILIETLLIWLAHGATEPIFNAFLEELLLQPNAAEACNTLVEVAITVEISDLSHQEDIFAMAVALICELGLAVQSIKRQYPEEFPHADKLLSNIATYLLSVSNSSNNCIRLSLIHYFGVTEHASPAKPGFNRVLGRFGHTVMEHLFSLLFNKKTEAVALQYLLENIPYVLEADAQSQKILHETFKFYMLKRPERFALFVQTFTKYLQGLDAETVRGAMRTYMQHLGVLLRVASEVNHKDLGRELMLALGSFEDSPDRQEIIEQILRDPSMRPSFQESIKKLQHSATLEETGAFRSSKRGRKPSFAKTGALKTIDQVSFLGTQQAARAS